MNVTEANKPSEIKILPKNATEVINTILEQAIMWKASDVHIDPRTSDTMVRIRVDGIMEYLEPITKSLHDEVISRLKILSGARTDIHMLPQDGRWKVDVFGQDYNIRISFLPTYHGQNAVIRLLPARIDQSLSFAKLGFIPEHVSIIDSVLNKTSGLILVTGPTGSGKTTTLHTCLVLKAREPLSIITLEDPVEYEIQGVRQVHIRHNQGVTFASGLRSALRQDPDVLMVGEIRDMETAQTTIHTALTGHLVLSTLHTNSAIEAIPRLMDMGIDPYLLSSTLKLIVAQRLVRKMCHECMGYGCHSCRNTGYIGRSVIAEVLRVDEKIKEFISNKATVEVISKYARSKGFRTLLEDANEKSEWGVTTKSEILRVLNEH